MINWLRKSAVEKELESPPLSNTEDEAKWLSENWVEGQMMGMTLASNDSVVYHLFSETASRPELPFEFEVVGFDEKADFISGLFDGLGDIPPGVGI